MLLFDFLFGEGQAIGYIKKGLEQALRPAEIIESLSTAGLTIRPDLANRVIEYLGTTILPDIQYIKQLQQFAQPNLTRIPLALTKTLRNFTYEVSVQGIEKATREISTRTINISTNTILTKQQAVDIATELSTGETKSGGLESGAGKVTAIYQNPAGLVLP